MMRIPHSRLYLLPTATLLLLCGACAGRDDAYLICPEMEEGQRLEVRFDWDRAPAADPEGMSLLFFPDAERRDGVWRFEVAGRDGGPVDIPHGQYRMLAVSNDSRTAYLTGTGAYETLTLNASVGDDGVARPTGMVFAGAVGRLTFNASGVTYTQADGSTRHCPQGLMRCQPDSLTTLFTIIATDTSGLQRIASARASLSGVARAVNVASGRPDGNGSCLISANLRPDSPSRLIGSTTAPPPADSAGTHTLTLDVVLSDGTTLRRRFDVSTQVSLSRFAHHVVISVDDLGIPPGPIGPDEPDVGIDVDVDGWEVIWTDLPTGP